MAETLNIAVKRFSGFVARYGGEEFAVIFPNLNKTEVFNAAEEIRIQIEALAIPHTNSLVSKVVTISIGVSTIIPNLNQSEIDLIKAADTALYVAKKQRNVTISAA